MSYGVWKHPHSRGPSRLGLVEIHTLENQPFPSPAQEAASMKDRHPSERVYVGLVTGTCLAESGPNDGCVRRSGKRPRSRNLKKGVIPDLRAGPQRAWFHRNYRDGPGSGSPPASPRGITDAGAGVHRGWGRLRARHRRRRPAGGIWAVRPGNSPNTSTNPRSIVIKEHGSRSGPNAELARRDGRGGRRCRSMSPITPSSPQGRGGHR